jgi:hypothetical protein
VGETPYFIQVSEIPCVRTGMSNEEETKMMSSVTVDRV